jgi:hypothetical protein
MEYAVGVQLFDRIRETKAVYIDKTEYVWRMVNTPATNFFLSRPRRFGKSLLVDTLRCYFEGRKELFEGLYIYDKETEWRQYPVVRIDRSRGKYFDESELHSILDSVLNDHERRWGINVTDRRSYGKRLTDIIQEAHRGCTILEGTGWYTKDPVKIVMVMCRKHESVNIFRIIKETDREAIITQSNVNGVYGFGFDELKVRVHSKKLDKPAD